MLSLGLALRLAWVSAVPGGCNSAPNPKDVEAQQTVLLDGLGDRTAAGGNVLIGGLLR